MTENSAASDKKLETILLVDDEEMILDSGEKMLRILDYDVITASDGSSTDSLPAFSVTVTQSANGAVTLSWTPPP